MRLKSIKRISAILGTMLIATASLPASSVSAATHDYTTAFKDSIYFYDANKCGKDAGENNVFSWRGACHTTDGSDVSLDLSGGYHDCGDHVKFGLPQCYAAAVLGWSLYEYRDVFDSVGNTEKMLQQLKHFTDYFLKCHPNANTFYYQVGDGDTDHAYWGAPEVQTTSRPALYKADSTHPASDVLGEASAALALMYMNYKSVDSTYANKCLVAAKELYAMGKANQGKSSGQSYYQSNSYNDDLAWGAAWLYSATNDSTYLTDAKYFAELKDSLKTTWTMCWDDVNLPVAFKLWQLTNMDKYKVAVDFNLNYWENQIKTTPGGLKFLTEWGVLRYSAAESMVALLYYKDTKDQAAYSLAKSQIDYILGSNPANMSYIVGFGNKWPLHPHHRAANGYTYANGDNRKPAKNLLLGALVGGPNSSDSYTDEVDQYQYTEVGLDYNAGLVGALAGAVKYFGGIIEKNSSISPTTASFDKNTAKQADIAVTLTLNGNTLNRIKNGTVALLADTDYTISGTTVNILKSYLAKQELGTVNLTFDFSAGIDPKLSINVIDSSINNSTISPRTASFDKNTAKQADISVDLTLNGNTFSGIKNGTTALVAGTDYTVSGTTVTILKSYLAKEPLGITNLTFDFSAGLDPVLAITIADTSIPAGNIKVQMFNGITSATTNGITPKFKLINSGNTSVNLADVKIRYYYTIDGENSQSFWCDYSPVGSSNVSGSFVKLGTAKTGADYYLEVGFSSAAGNLAAGQSIDVQTRFSKSDWTNYTQTGDYSFDSTDTTYVDSAKTPAYISGSLQWGVEP